MTATDPTTGRLSGDDPHRPVQTWWQIVAGPVLVAVLAGLGVGYGLAQLDGDPDPDACVRALDQAETVLSVANDSMAEARDVIAILGDGPLSATDRSRISEAAARVRAGGEQVGSMAESYDRNARACRG